MLLEEFDTLIQRLLSLEEFAGTDMALNGLQVSNSEASVEKAAFAVDACLESIRRAAEWKADLLFVHHGLFWGRPLAVTGGHYQRIRALIQADLALYAVHLPLDMHAELGNNAGLARRIGLQQLEPFGEYKGTKIGFKGTLPEARSLEQVVRACCGAEDRGISVLPFGPEAVRTIGIVSGGAADEAYQAIEEKLDLFITGDASHTIYHHCLEGHINVIFGGHYLTETSGVTLLAEKLQSETDLQTRFFDIPTGL
ncbi:MAG: Nif3-like dinuclear metal center hexameric protein [Spirochaetaceae bacterium]|nr:MAG: Nif3-like dinuclear metal center hexameric protein [Spirochaetaceae bacterium]